LHSALVFSYLVLTICHVAVQVILSSYIISHKYILIMFGGWHFSRTSASECLYFTCTTYPSQDIPSTGIDDWFDLEARSSRSNVEGQIRLRLNLATREDRGYFEEDPYTEIKEHEDLMCVFIEHEIKSFKVQLPIMSCAVTKWCLSMELM